MKVKERIINKKNRREILKLFLMFLRMHFRNVSPLFNWMLSLGVWEIVVPRMLGVQNLLKMGCIK